MALIDTGYWTTGLLSPRIVQIAQSYNIRVTHYEKDGDDRSGYSFHGRSDYYSVVTIKELAALFENDDYEGIDRLVPRACQNLTDDMAGPYALRAEQVAVSAKRD